MENENINFFTTDILLKGKHAVYADFLAKPRDQDKDNKPRAAVFDTLCDLYEIAILVGLYMGLKKPEDKESNARKRIFADKVVREQSNLRYIYSLVMLVDSSIVDPDEKIKRAFGDPTSDTMELFNSYFRGGVEWLYDEIASQLITKEQYILKIYEMVKNFQEEFQDLK